MKPLLDLYHSVVPAGVRVVVSGRKARLGRWLGAMRERPARRDAAADLWVSLRRPVRPVSTRFGTVYVDVRDRGVGRKIYRDGRYEPAETRFLAARLAPGMTYLDVGANLGYFVALAASRVGPAGRAIAIEPDPYNFRLLSRTVRANGWPHVRPFNVAAGAEPGTARLFKSPENLGDHRLYADSQTAVRHAVEVPVVRLDDLFARERLPAPDLVKMDVQGYEGLVARGMTGLLGGDRPLTVLTEFWPHGMENAGTDPREFLDTFRSLSFGCFAPTEDGGLRPVAWDAVWQLVPPFDPRLPDASYTNLVFARGPGGRP